MSDPKIGDFETARVLTKMALYFRRNRGSIAKNRKYFYEEANLPVWEYDFSVSGRRLSFKTQFNYMNEKNSQTQETLAAPTGIPSGTETPTEEAEVDLTARGSLKGIRQAIEDMRDAQVWLRRELTGIR